MNIICCYIMKILYDQMPKKWFKIFTNIFLTFICYLVNQQQIANNIGQDLNIRNENIMGDMSPEHKLNFIKDLQNNDKQVLFCGDGFNDAPAIKAATIGISLGHTQNLTSQVADIVILPPRSIDR
eukprot:UN14161